MKPHNSFSNIRSLHALRGVAAFLVVIIHSKYILWCGGSEYIATIGLSSIFDYFLFAIDMLCSCGHQCVVVFFLLSAFVIKYSFTRNNYTIREFYFFRIVRIYWPFIFSLIASIGILILCYYQINNAAFTNDSAEYNSRLLANWENLNLKTILFTIAFIANPEYAGLNIAYWSLLHELIFYIVFPLYHLLNRNKLILLTIGLMIIYAVTQNFIIYCQIFFAVGLLLFYYFEEKQQPLIKMNKWFYLIVIMILYGGINLLRNVTEGLELADLATVILVFFVFEAVLIKKISPKKILFSLGDISYSLYLIHVPLLMLMYCALSYYTQELIFYERYYYYLAIPICVLISIPFYLLFEKPSINYLKKIKNRKSI